VFLTSLKGQHLPFFISLSSPVLSCSWRLGGRPWPPLLAPIHCGRRRGGQQRGRAVGREGAGQGGNSRARSSPLPRACSLAPVLHATTGHRPRRLLVPPFMEATTVWPHPVSHGGAELGLRPGDHGGRSRRGPRRVPGPRPRPTAMEVARRAWTSPSATSASLSWGLPSAVTCPHGLPAPAGHGTPRISTCAAGRGVEGVTPQVFN
jgi:hypothetical protein